MKDTADTFTQFCYAKLQQTGGGKNGFYRFSLLCRRPKFSCRRLLFILNNIIALPPAASFAVRQNSDINTVLNWANFADFRTSPLYKRRKNYDYNRYRLPKAVFQAGEKRKYAGENRTESTILVADIQKSIR